MGLKREGGATRRSASEGAPRALPWSALATLELPASVLGEALPSLSSSCEHCKHIPESGVQGKDLVHVRNGVSTCEVPGPTRRPLPPPASRHHGHQRRCRSGNERQHHHQPRSSRAGGTGGQQGPLKGMHVWRGVQGKLLLRPPQNLPMLGCGCLNLSFIVFFIWIPCCLGCN